MSVTTMPLHPELRELWVAQQPSSAALRRTKRSGGLLVTVGVLLAAVGGQAIAGVMEPAPAEVATPAPPAPPAPAPVAEPAPVAVPSAPRSPAPAQAARPARRAARPVAARIEAPVAVAHSGGVPAGMLDIRASFGLAGDGVRDDAPALSRALAEGRGPLYLPAGTYLVGSPVPVPSGTALFLDPGAVLRAAPVPWKNRGVLDVMGAQNVSISGGTLDGNHDANPVGRGFGIRVYDSAGVRLSGVTAVNFPASDPTGMSAGDGIYVGGKNPSRDIVIENCRLAGNVRQGISVTHADGVVIRGCDISGTRGKMPGAGIDLEPNLGLSVRNVQVLDNRLTGNHIGLLVLGEQGGHHLGEVRGIRIANNHFANNRFLPMVVRQAEVVLENNVGL